MPLVAATLQKQQRILRLSIARDGTLRHARFGQRICAQRARVSAARLRYSLRDMRAMPRCQPRVAAEAHKKARALVAQRITHIRLPFCASYARYTIAAALMPRHADAAAPWPNYAVADV